MANNPSAEELAERLRQAEEIIETLRNFQVDAVVGTSQVGMLRLKEVEDQLAEQAEIAANRMAEIESIYQNVPVGLCVLDRDLRYLRINRHLATINGVPAEEHLGRTVRELFPRLADIVEEGLLEVIETGEPLMNVEISGETPAQRGVKRHWLVHRLPLHDKRGHVIGINMVIEETTERKQFEEELQQLNATLEERVADRTMVAEQRAERLREMAVEMARVEEKERQRLARLLHDGLQQLLVGAKYSAGLIRGRLSRRDDVKEPFDQLDRILNQSIKASRSLSYDLSPPILHDQELGPALSWLADQVRSNQGLTVDFSSEGEIPKISQGLKVFLFQAVRELLLNIVKHAGVDRAEVRLSTAGEDVCIDVRDQGCGFDASIIDFDAPAGLGLKSFRKRLELMNGRMTIESGLGQGCRIALCVPNDMDRGETPRPGTVAEATDEPDGGEGNAAGSSPSQRSGPTTVLVVDDHRILRSGLVSLLAEEPDIEVVGEAGDGLEAVASVRRSPPDVVVMDISMPKMNGIEATRRIHEEFPDVRILGLSMHQEGEYGELMKKAGATDLLNKGGPADLLLEAIRGSGETTKLNPGTPPPAA